MLRAVTMLLAGLVVLQSLQAQEAGSDVMDLEQMIVDAETDIAGRDRLLQALPTAPIALALLSDKDPGPDGNLPPGTKLSIYVVRLDGVAEAMIFTSPEVAQRIIRERHLVTRETGQSAAAVIVGNARSPSLGFWLKGARGEIRLTPAEAAQLASAPPTKGARRPLS